MGAAWGDELRATWGDELRARWGLREARGGAVQRGEGTGLRGPAALAAGWPTVVAGGGGGRQMGWRFGMTCFFHFSFFGFLCWVPVHLSRLCHISAERWVPHISFCVNSAIQNQCTLLAICWILMVFCDSNVKSWISKIYPSISWFYANYSPGICTGSPVNFDRARPLMTKYDGLITTKFYFSFSFFITTLSNEKECSMIYYHLVQDLY
jgi:hypothetical protein